MLPRKELAGESACPTSPVMVPSRFMPASHHVSDPPEMTFRAVALGLFLALVFGAANAYLGMKAGQTIAATIPAAVIAIAVFRVMGRPGTECAGINRHVVGDERALQERRSDSILTSSLAPVAARRQAKRRQRQRWAGRLSSEN